MMNKKNMSSRGRMLAALNREETDYTPCSFMLYGALKGRCKNYSEFLDRQIDLGLDTVMELPIRPPLVKNDHYNLHGLPVNHHPSVKIKEWTERINGEDWPILVKEYHTPAGILRTEVRQTDDWRWGKHVPFLDDYVIPRARKHLVTHQEDLEPLRFLLVPPSPEEIDIFKRESDSAISQAHQHELLVSGGWGVGADLIGWICGLDNLIYLSYDCPDFFIELLELISDWNRQRMIVFLDFGIDLYIKRAWYENLDFFTPHTWKKFVYPILKRDVELAHSYGAKFGYLITSSCMPLLELFVESGMDVIVGLDPLKWDLEETKRRVGDHICLWGGVNGHITVEMGTEKDVALEVERALNILAPGSGFILSPVDNVREDTEISRANVRTLINTWKNLTGQI
jgi:uroporphyrinogen-III decarboxylase